MNDCTKGNVLFLQQFEEMKRLFPHKSVIRTNKYSFDYLSISKYSDQIARIILNEYNDTYLLTKNEQTRYMRQMVMDGWGIESQEKLKASCVFVAGAGGSGSPLIIQLALLGIGNIIVCDYDNVELSNLNRQCLHNESRIGINKAISARMSVEEINPNVNIIACTEKITRENVCQLVGDAAIIFDNVDDIESKFILSECAVYKRIPHIISSMIDLSSYAAIFHTPKTPCLHCIYDISVVNDINTIKRYRENYKKKAIPVAAPSLFLSTGFVCNEALKIILGIGTVAYNKYFIFNQKASDNFAETDGFKMITYPFNDYFKRMCKEQGFDLAAGWNGNFIEEITISKNPDCLICGGNNKKMSIHLNSCKENIITNSDLNIKQKATGYKQIVTFLLDDCVEIAASSL